MTLNLPSPADRSGCGRLVSRLNAAPIPNASPASHHAHSSLQNNLINFILHQFGIYEVILTSPPPQPPSTQLPAVRKHRQSTLSQLWLGTSTVTFTSSLTDRGSKGVGMMGAAIITETRYLVVSVPRNISASTPALHLAVLCFIATLHLPRPTLPCKVEMQ